MRFSTTTYQRTGHHTRLYAQRQDLQAEGTDQEICSDAEDYDEGYVAEAGSVRMPATPEDINIYDDSCSCRQTQDEYSASRGAVVGILSREKSKDASCVKRLNDGYACGSATFRSLVPYSSD